MVPNLKNQYGHTQNSQLMLGIYFVFSGVVFLCDVVLRFYAVFNFVGNESQKQDVWHCGQNTMTLSLSLRPFRSKNEIYMNVLNNVWAIYYKSLT